MTAAVLAAAINLLGRGPTLGDLQTGIAALQKIPTTDLQAAVAQKFGNLSADATLTEDMLIDLGEAFPALALEAGIGAAVIAAIVIVLTYGKQDKPGSQMRIDYGRRGSDPNLPQDEPAI